MLKLILKYALSCAILWTLIIFGLCCMPGNYIPTTNWLEILSFDKFVHAFIFFVMVSLWFLVLVQKSIVSKFSIILVLLICVAFGGMLEIMQASVFSNRNADWFDFIANSFGSFIAWLLFYKKKLFLMKRNTSERIQNT